MSKKHSSAARKLAIVKTPTLKLDFGCGPNKREGFEGVDAIAFVGVDHVVDLRKAPWPFADGSVAEAHASHFLEHLTATERVTFCNELFRVLAIGAKATIIVPHWASCRAYGDPTHQWPPVSEFWFYYLLQSWRDQNAPHTDVKNVKGMFACDFDASWGYQLNPALTVRNEEFRQFATQNYKEAISDMCATLIKREPPAPAAPVEKKRK